MTDDHGPIPPAGPWVLHGARLLDADGERQGGWVAVQNGLIVAVGDGARSDGTGWRDLAAEGFEAVDAGSLAVGATLVPGFVDLHGHGGGGFGYEDGAGGIRSALALHRAHGTTSSVLSLVSAPVEALVRQLRVIADLTLGDGTDADRTVLGSHLEGPFLAPGRRGAHDPATLRPPSAALVDALLEAACGTLRQVTVAPELPGALDAIRRFAEAGVVVAVGHTDAGHALAAEAFDAGATLLTHAFNAMPGLHHRDPGPVAAALDAPSVVLELIADGVHVHPRLVRLLFDAAPGRIALVTDAMAAAGAPDGDYRLGSVEVTVREGCARLSGTSTLAGSTLTQDAALRSALASGVDEVRAVEALTATPARALGLDGRAGLVAPGRLADLVLLGEPPEGEGPGDVGDGPERETRGHAVRHVWVRGRPGDGRTGR